MFQSSVFGVSSRKLLATCSNSLIAKKELSAQQVASYLLCFEDHFTSHKFQSLHWKSFKSYISKEQRELRGDDETVLTLLQTSSICQPAPCNVDKTYGNDMNDDEELDGDESDDDDSNKNETVLVGRSTDGSLMAHSNAVTDYVYRGQPFNNFALWYFVSNTEKIHIKAEQLRLRKQTQSSNEYDENSDSENSCTDSDMDYNDLVFLDSLITRRGRKTCLRSKFLPSHPEHSTHMLRMRTSQSSLIPVPVGPRLYRRDRPDVYEQYCRLMLIFFKPWRTLSDLLLPTDTWSSAFSSFLLTTNDEIKQVINNMQQLHECRDSRDDHFAKNRVRLRGFDNRPLFFNSDDKDDNINDSSTDLDVLLNLQHIKALNSKKIAAEMRECVLAMDVLVRNGFVANDDVINQMLISTNPNVNLSFSICVDNNQDMENIWKKEYDNQRDLWKKQFLQHTIEQLPTLSNNILPTEHCEFNEPNSLIRRLASEYTLNDEQTFAFELIAKHSLNKTSPENQLQMFISGPGGTGKSRVITCLKAWFTSRNESERFCVAAYTGTAANNISGVTIHSTMNFSVSTKSSGKSSKELTSMWRNVEYFLIDEHSMLGCEFVVDISKTMSFAKECVNVYGSVNMIYCGDFCQLPPVGGTPLYRKLHTENNSVQSQTTLGQKAMAGRLLWLGVNTVVTLYEQMRQSGQDNENFCTLLLRVSAGIATDDDFELLNSRVIDNAFVDLSSSDWTECPIITRQNQVKDVLNMCCTQTYASRCNLPINYYYSEDFEGSNQISDTTLQDLLYELHSGQSKLLGILPLVEGMKVIFTQNYDVSGGVVNGSEGILQSVQYKIDNYGCKVAMSCVVLVTTTSCQALPTLVEKQVVALQETSEFNMRNPVTNQNARFRRRQLPIFPAYAMTDYKAQGRTLEHVIVDISGNHAAVLKVVLSLC